MTTYMEFLEDHLKSHPYVETDLLIEYLREEVSCFRKVQFRNGYVTHIRCNVTGTDVDKLHEVVDKYDVAFDWMNVDSSFYPDEEVGESTGVKLMLSFPILRETKTQEEE